MDSEGIVKELVKKPPTEAVKEIWFDGVDEVFINAYSEGCKSVEDFANRLHTYVAECVEESGDEGIQSTLEFLRIIDWLTIAKELAIEHELKLEGLDE